MGSLFPKWEPKDLSKECPLLDLNGVDLQRVSIFSLSLVISLNCECPTYECYLYLFIIYIVLCLQTLVQTVKYTIR